MDASSLVHLLIQIIVIGLICWLLFWAVGKIGLPEPFNKIAVAIIVLIACLFLINLLLTLSGSGPILKLN